MNITRETIKSTLRNIMSEESEYQTFFKKALEKAGKSIPSMSDEEKKEFFNKIDAAWNAKGEKNEGNAFGAAVVAAKEKGEDEFKVGGKTYKVEEASKTDIVSIAKMARFYPINIVVSTKGSKGVGAVKHKEKVNTPKEVSDVLNKLQKKYSTSGHHFSVEDKNRNIVFYEDVNEGKKLKQVKKDKYGNHLEPQFKKGELVTYLGHPAIITRVNKEMGGVYSYDVDYNKGYGRTKVSNIFNKSGNELKESVNEEETFTATNKETGETSVFKSKDARDAAVKAGTHAKKDEKDVDTSKGKEKPNMFSKDTGYDAGGDSEPKKKTGLSGFIQKMRDKQKEKELADRRYPDFKKDAIIVSAIDKNGEKQEWMTKMSREEITDHMNQKVEDGEAKSYQLMRFNYYYRPVPIDESAGCGCGCGCGGSKMNEEFKSKDSTFEKVYGIFDKKDYFNAKGLAKTQIGNFERALQRNDKGAQQILDKFKGDMDKAKDYIIQVITDRKKEDAFNQYKAFKAAVDSIQKGKPIYGAVDLVKSRIHNNSQKYTMALYSALRNQKFNKWKDIHADVDSLIGEEVKVSEELTFEINTFLERPVLSKNEITLEKSEMKDVVTLLVKEGFQKRLSSGVKKEFIELLKSI